MVFILLIRRKSELFKIIGITFIFLVFVALLVIFFIYNRNRNIDPSFKNVSKSYGNSIISIDDGYVIVGSNNQNNKSLEKATLSIYNSSNQKLLEKVYSSGYNSNFYDVIYDDENYIAVGSFESTKSDYRQGNELALLVKFDNNGEIIFDKDFEVKSDSLYKSVINTQDGYIVCGKSINTSSQIGNSGAVLVKYDKDGNEIWRNYQGNINAAYNDLLYVDNKIYVVGVDNNIGILSIFDNDGNLIRNIYHDNLSNTGLTSIVLCNDQLIVSGGKIIDNLEHGVIISYSLNGDYIKEVVYEEKNTTYHKLLVDSNKNIIVVGNIYSNNNDINYGIIGKYTNNLEEMSVVKHISNRDVTFNDLASFDNKYMVVGNSKSESSISSKVFLFSSSLKNLG